MANVSITKEFSWDMAHMLSDHKGLCENLHGHTYKMQVKVFRKDKGLIQNTLHSNGMVLDFSELKAVVNKKIVEPLDHAFMYWRKSNDPVEHDIAHLLINSGKKVAAVEYRPTAEEMANSFFNILSHELTGCDIVIDSVKVWETAESCAEVTRGERYECC